MAVVKIRSLILEEMLLTDYVGLKCAFGENPKRVYGTKGVMPATRMGVAAVLRKALHDVSVYKAKKDFHATKPEKDGEPIRMRILGEDLLAVRNTEDRVGFLNAYCPHKLAALFYGRNEDCGLRCSYHGWKFDLDGNCVDILK